VSARLDSDYRLGLVSAPAGYGKTVALASWAAEHADRLAWLSCDPLDVEPTRFMTSLLSAISARWPGVADDAFVLLERAGAGSYDSVVAVANDLAAVDVPGVIVVDDLHLAAPSADMMTAFYEALPDGFRFVVGTRSDPPLSLARRRVRGELLELRGEDLRFTAAETAEFFDQHEVSLAADEVRRVHELTEGWPAGVQLAAIAMQRAAARDDLLDAFATSDRAVGDFLVSEVLATLPSDLVNFLVETSVLDIFDAELCAAVTGVAEAALVLEGLAAADLFVVPLDERWYRYHHLFGAFLRARLASLGTSRVRAAHDRASRCLEERGDVEGALGHAMAIGDVERAGWILRAALERSLSMSEGADVSVRAVRVWLHEFGPAFVETEPAWVVEFVIGLIMLTGPDDAPSWLERVRRAHPDADGELTALIEGGWSEHHQYRGQPLEALGHLRLAMDAVGGAPSNRGLLPLLYAGTARAFLQAGELDQAGAVLERALTHPVGNLLTDEVRNPGIAAFVAARSGELSAAEALARRVAGSAEQFDLRGPEVGRICAGLALAELHLERREDEEAVQVLEEVAQASDASHRPTLQSLVSLHRAKLARVLGDEALAAALLAETRLLYPDADAAVRQVLGEEAVAQSLRFDPSTTDALLRELDQGRVTTRVLRARLALLAKDARMARALLADLPPPTTRRARAERGVLRGLSLLETDVDGANTALRDALDAAEPERLIRTIVDQLGVHKLLLSFAPDARQERFLEELITATSHVVGPVRAPVMTTLIDPLSAREVEVLRYWCSRMTYREIAAALYVSLNTLKTHVRTVYRKLDVESRADAVDAGRRLGVI
jgi:LuxR family maltose regulon positive regulatory protein